MSPWEGSPLVLMHKHWKSKSEQSDLMGKIPVLWHQENYENLSWTLFTANIQDIEPDRNTEYMFLFLLEYSVTGKRKTTCQFDDFWLLKRKVSLLVPSLRQQLVLVLVFPSSYRNTIFNQSARIFFQDCFLNYFIFR